MYAELLQLGSAYETVITLISSNFKTNIEYSIYISSCEIESNFIKACFFTHSLEIVSFSKETWNRSFKKRREKTSAQNISRWMYKDDNFNSNSIWKIAKISDIQAQNGSV